jgi:HEAT repeat protein
MLLIGCQEARHDPRVQELITQLKTGDDGARVHAADELRRIGPGAKAAVPALIENLGDGHQHQMVNVAATNALLRIGPGAALAPLVAALDSDDPQIAYGAAFTIGGFGHAARSAAPALLKALERPQTRGAANVALKMIQED